MDKVTYCYLCQHRAIGEKVITFVESTRFEHLCMATKPYIRCEDRNTEGKCEHYLDVGRDYPW